MTAETTRFGINEEGVHLDIPRPVADAIVKRDTNRLVQRLLRADHPGKPVKLIEIEGGQRVQLRPRKLATLDTPARTIAAQTMIQTVQAIVSRTPNGMADPRIDLLMSYEKIATTGNFAVSAGVAWPDNVTDEELAARVTNAMVQSATAMKWQHPDRIAANVKASIARTEGIRLDTAAQEMGGQITTVGVYPYNPNAPMAVLESYALADRRQQIIGLHGLVAFIEGGR
jgi:hypothetical protein